MASTIAKKITTIVYNPTGFREIPCHFPFSAFFDCTFANTILPAGFTRYCPFTFTIYQYKKSGNQLASLENLWYNYFNCALEPCRMARTFDVVLPKRRVEKDTEVNTAQRASGDFARHLLANF
ncbi:hypothetical protein, partial [uncultured Ruminococcus sp.]|uniref:hypothetical protein n=1 Tax=uncultured Ruminococcus sp. TaxID=165186 RepID=UPI002664F6F3